ncbi:CRS2-associated factor 2, chloroplastic [Vitis vinifera]|uniref:CRS2-associated factor 2, chloroplastic n=1 Tax=Vitis vinifera TaxID=29760 RepID=A0A438J6D7_VITVI|nr:CRS2-associated factor 2, chloroplastic [Vitis vinifera]
MVILATLPGSSSLFSSLPQGPPPNDSTTSTPPQPPIPIPKYPPPLKSQKSSRPPTKPPTPAFKTVHHRSKYYKPVSDGVIASDGDRSVVIGESGVSYLLPEHHSSSSSVTPRRPKLSPWQSGSRHSCPLLRPQCQGRGLGRRH